MTNVAVKISRLEGDHASDCVAHFMEAAVRGDAWACVKLAAAYANGDMGLALNENLAKRWYEKALACTDRDGEAPDEDDVRTATEWLEAHKHVESTWKC